MNSIDDLKRTLDAHAPDATTDAGLMGRPAAVAHRVTAVRRRRAAVGSALAVAVIGGGGVLAAGLPGQQTSSGPAQDPTSSATNGPAMLVPFPPELANSTLVASTMGEPGEDVIDLPMELPAEPVFVFYCARPAGAGSDGADRPTIEVEVEGWTALTVSCGTDDPDYDPDEHRVKGTVNFGLDSEQGLSVSRTAADGTRLERHLAPGSDIVFRARLTDSDEGPYDGTLDGLKLGLGVYAGN